MTLSPALAALLAQLPPTDLQLGTLLEAIYATRYTGPVTLDCLNGIPQQINLGQPVKLSICAGVSTHPPRGLDKTKANSSG